MDSARLCSNVFPWKRHRQMLSINTGSKSRRSELEDDFHLHRKDNC
jgi:hypothetical protein